MILYENSRKQIRMQPHLSKLKGFYQHLPEPTQALIRALNQLNGKDLFLEVFSSEAECYLVIAQDCIQDLEDYFLDINIHDFIGTLLKNNEVPKIIDCSLLVYRFTKNEKFPILLDSSVHFHRTNDDNSELEHIKNAFESALTQDLYVLPSYHLAENRRRNRKLQNALNSDFFDDSIRQKLFSLQTLCRKLGYDFIAGYGDYAPVEIVIMDIDSIVAQHNFSKQNSDESFIDKPLCIICMNEGSLYQDYNLQIKGNDYLSKDEIAKAIQELNETCDQMDNDNEETFNEFDHDDEILEFDNFLSDYAPQVKQALQDLEKYCKQHQMLTLQAGAKYSIYEKMIVTDNKYWNTTYGNYYDKYEQQPFGFVCLDLNDWKLYYEDHYDDCKLTFKLVQNQSLDKELLNKIKCVEKAVQQFNDKQHD